MNDGEKREDQEKTTAAVKRVLLEHVNKREAEALKILMNHPNVIKIYHTVEDDDFKYFALELCAASMDDTFLPDDSPKKYKGPLPSDLDAILQLSEGMQYIHENGFVHRDVKPGNVLISFHNNEGNVALKWSDFGLSKPVSTQKTFSVSGLRGTMNWIAPEILEIIDRVLDGSHVSHGTVKSDIWSAGCVIFAYLTKGKHPFGKNSMEIITNMRDSKPINLQEFPKDHFAMNLIREMIAKDPAKRKKLVEVIEILEKVKEETKRRMHAIMRPELETGVVYHWNQWSLALDWSKLYVWSDDVSIMGIPTRAGYASEMTCILGKSNIKLNHAGRSVMSTNEGRDEEEDLNTRILRIVNIVPGTPGKLLLNANNGGSSTIIIPIGEERSICQINDDLILVKRSQKEIQEVDDIQDLLAKSIQIKLHGNWLSSGFHFLNADGEWQVFMSDTAQRTLEKELLDLCALSIPEPRQLDRVEAILKAGVDPNHFEGLNGQTPLLLCLRNQDGETRLNCLKKLLEGNQRRSKGTIPRKVDLHLRDRQEKNAFHALLEKQSDYNHVIYEALEVLVKNGIDVNMKDQDGRNSLHLLCLHYRKENIVDAMKLLVANGVDVKSMDNTGATALHFLCEYYYKDNIVDPIQFLIDNGVDGDVNLTNEEGCTALHLLCWNYRNENIVDAMKLLIDNGSDVNLKNEEGCTALHYLILYERKEDCLCPMKLLIQCGIDVNIMDNYGRTVLHKLFNNYKNENFVDVMKLLIESGINVNLKAGHCRNALHLLCWYYKEENIVDAMKLLIDKGVDVKQPDKTGWSVLHYLCYHYGLETIVDVMKLLIDSGADAGVKNEHGNTALHYLCENYRNENIIDGMKLLVDNGVDATSINNYGRTALHLLCEKYSNENLVDAIGLLMKSGIDVTLKDAESRTALHYLCGNYDKDNTIDGIKLIIDSYIDVNLQDSNGRTALHNLCLSYKNENLLDAMKLLVEKGADVQLKDKEGRNALHFLCATSKDNLADRIKFLVDHGIDVNVQDIKNGWSALHYFACKSYRDDGIIGGMKSLIDGGMDINLKDKDGRTALHHFCSWYRHDNFVDPFKLLVDSGIDVHARDREGRTALDILARYPEMAKFKVKIMEEILITTQT